MISNRHPNRSIAIIVKQMNNSIEYHITREAKQVIELVEYQPTTKTITTFIELLILIQDSKGCTKSRMKRYGLQGCDILLSYTQIMNWTVLFHLN